MQIVLIVIIGLIFLNFLLLFFSCGKEINKNNTIKIEKPFNMKPLKNSLNLKSNAKKHVAAVIGLLLVAVSIFSCKDTTEEHKLILFNFESEVEFVKPQDATFELISPENKFCELAALGNASTFLRYEIFEV